jgi:hypothetical protein
MDPGGPKTCGSGGSGTLVKNKDNHGPLTRHNRKPAFRLTPWQQHVGDCYQPVAGRTGAAAGGGGWPGRTGHHAHLLCHANLFHADVPGGEAGLLAQAQQLTGHKTVPVYVKFKKPQAGKE